MQLAYLGRVRIICSVQRTCIFGRLTGTLWRRIWANALWECKGPSGHHRRFSAGPKRHVQTVAQPKALRSFYNTNTAFLENIEQGCAPTEAPSAPPSAAPWPTAFKVGFSKNILLILAPRSTRDCLPCVYQQCLAPERSMPRPCFREEL